MWGKSHYFPSYLIIERSEAFNPVTLRGGLGLHRGAPQRNFLLDRRTGTIMIFIGPPPFSPVEDRGPVDFPMSDRCPFNSGISCKKIAVWGIHYQWLWPNCSPDLNLTPLAAFLRFLPSAARVRSDLSQFSWGRSEPKVVRWQIKDQSCFSYPEMMFQINLCYFLCWLVSLLLSWVQWNYSIGGKCCANVRLLQNTFTLSPMMHLSSQW